MTSLILLTVVQLAVMVRVLRRKTLNLMEVFFASGLLTYSIPLFVALLDPHSFPVTEPALRKATLSLMLFFAFLYLGFKAGRRVLPSPLTERGSSGEMDLYLSFPIFLGAVVLTVAPLLFDLRNSLSWPVYYTVLNWVLIYFLTSYKNVAKPLRTGIFIWILLMPPLLFFQVSGLYGFLTFITLIVIHSFAARVSLPLNLLIPLLIVGALTSNIRHLYKNKVSTVPRQESVLKKASIAANLVKDSFQPKNKDTNHSYVGLLPKSQPTSAAPVAEAIPHKVQVTPSYLSSVTKGVRETLKKLLVPFSVGATLVYRLASRYSDSSLLRVVEWVPERVDYWKGRTYRDLFWRLVPSSLRPANVLYHPWNDFGRELKYLDDYDRITSVSFSLFTEAYLNWGVTGLVTVALFLGFILALLQRVLAFDFGMLKPIVSTLVLFHSTNVALPLTSWIQILVQNLSLVFGLYFIGMTFSLLLRSIRFTSGNNQAVLSN